MDNTELNKDQLYRQALKLAALGTVAFPIVGQIVAASLLSKGYFKEGTASSSSKRMALAAAALVLLYMAFIAYFVMSYRSQLFSLD
ncbi:MAG: hypothetical protein WCI18_17290 [Pseudomonadota bacterium]